MMTKRINGLTACIGLAALALTGCGYPGNDQSEAEPEPAETVTAAPVDQDSTGGEDHGTEPSGDDAETGETDEPTVDEIDLTPDEGVQYLHAIQAFSPLLESWVVDEEAGMLSYMRYSCLGRLDDGGTGAIEPYNGDKWQVTWDGDSPLRLTSGQTERITITDRTLVLGTESSTISTEIELEKFIGMCDDAGDTVAGFVLS